MAKSPPYVFVPVLEAWPLVPIDQDPNLKHLIQPDPDAIAQPHVRRGPKRRPPTPDWLGNTTGRHGGRRPGAGAPRGNINALKTGAHADRFVEAVRLVHIVPALKQIVHEVARISGGKDHRKRYRNALALAYTAALLDEETANAIRTLLIQGLARTAVRLNLATPEMAAKAQLPDHNNQTIKRNKCRDEASAPSANAPSTGQHPKP